VNLDFGVAIFGVGVCAVYWFLLKRAATAPKKREEKEQQGNRPAAFKKMYVLLNDA
jgi:hypothetical protein